MSKHLSPSQPTTFLKQKPTLTFLTLALRRRKSGLPSICRIRTRIELLIAASLQRSTQVHKRVALDLEGTLHVSRVNDGGGRNAAEGTGERLGIGGAEVEDSRTGKGGEEEDKERS